MSTNFLTIGDMLAGTTAKASALPKSDASGEGTPFSMTAEHRSSPVGTARPKTPYNNTNTADARSKSVGKLPKDFSQALHEEAKSEAPQETQNSAESNGQGPGFNAAQQPDIVQAWWAMNSVPVEQSRDAAATRIEPKAGRQLAELLAAAKAEKSPPAIGRTAQSVEIRPLPTNSEDPLGFDSVSSGTIRHTPAATIQPVETATDGIVSSSSGTVIDTETAIQQGTHVKVPSPEVPADSGGETITETSPVAVTPTAPAPNIKSPMTETPIGNSGKATEAPQETQNSAESNGQGPGFNSAQQPDIVQAWRAMNSVLVEQSRDGAATRIEPKAGRQLAELIAAAKTEKSPPATGRTEQSVVIKPPATTDKNPLGLDSVSPGTIRHTPAATIRPAEAAIVSTVSSSNETVIDTKAITQQNTHVKALSPEVPADTGDETITAVKEPTIAETLPVADIPAAPASNMNSPVPETLIDDGGKATNVDGNANTTDGRITAVQAGLSKTQSELVAIASDKSLQATDNGGETITAAKEPTITEISPVVGTLIAPASNIKSPMSEIPVDDGGKAIEAPQETQNSPESNGQGPGFNAVKQPDIVQAWRVMNSVPVEQSRDGAATRIKPKAGRQLAELIAAAKAEKSPPVTGKTAQSVEIKPLPTTDKGLLGLDSVSPETAKRMPAETIQPAEDVTIQPVEAATDGIVSSSSGTVIDTETAIQQGTHVKVPSPEVLIDDGDGTIAEISPVADTPAAPASNMNSSMPETPIDDGGKATDATGSANTAEARITAVQGGPSQTQPELVAIDPDKSLQADEVDAGSRQESLKPSNPGGEKPPQAENDLPDTHSISKPNIKDVQAPTDQTQSRGSYPDSEQILSQNGNQISFAEQLPTAQESAGTAGSPRPASTGDIAADVGKQIIESVQSSTSPQTADRQITVQLHPPELGKVFIKFQEQDAQISGTLEVSKAQTRSEIEQALPQIIQNLTDSGIQIKRLEVMLSQEDQSAQQAFKDPLQQDGSFGQHNPADSGSSGNGHETATGTYYGPTNDTGYQSAAELQEMPARDDSINFLV